MGAYCLSPFLLPKPFASSDALVTLSLLEDISLGLMCIERRLIGPNRKATQISIRTAGWTRFGLANALDTLVHPARGIRLS